MHTNNLTLNEIKRLINMVTNLNIKNRSLVIALILWFFFVFFGFHRFYIRKFFTGFCMVFLMIFGLITKFILIGYLFCGVVWLWWIYDLFMLLINTKKTSSILITKIN